MWWEITQVSFLLTYRQAQPACVKQKSSSFCHQTIVCLGHCCTVAVVLLWSLHTLARYICFVVARPDMPLPPPLPSNPPPYSCAHLFPLTEICQDVEEIRLVFYFVCQIHLSVVEDETNPKKASVPIQKKQVWETCLLSLTESDQNSA